MTTGHTTPDAYSGPQDTDRSLLLNRDTVTRLTEAGLTDLCVRDLDLQGARQLGHWQTSDGTGIYLLTLVSAAIRQVTQAYFDGRACRAGLSEIRTRHRQSRPPRLPALYREFLVHFPRPALTAALDKESPSGANCRRLILGELFLLEVLHDNPATQPYRELFDDGDLTEKVDYRDLLAEVAKLLHTEETDRFAEVSLPELLRAPLRAAPESLAGQLGFILEHWSAWLPKEFLVALRVGQAIVREEAEFRGPGPGPTRSPAIGLGDDAGLPPAFTSDTDWMASSVLLAKSIYVWLDQLSQRYQRAIRTLRDIPDEELALLAHWGFNALWLIGIWERSHASRTIKQLSGNPEAEASAYALHAYRVAVDLGGEEALDELETRCRNHGIRLACDVVPNHTGIDSEWVREHPDWFLQTEQAPYPGYRFSGPDLCQDPGCSIRIEDGYWDHSDAAVVFEHVDHATDRRRYIYHGNDGTHMPWNDTAQLNFLLPEVRQAMSDLIVRIARRFRLIRFDAAMTLARKHFRRLWFPPPGGSAGVPSRSSFWMDDADFARAFPTEFWREVVDRINREVPDTLLVAEAFWLMEGYFVRTLGMHRVYNSAFMNMLKREENAKYRKILKDTLAYNPEILKRYVNFMNNPDEATAVAQFGKGDKYFATAVLLATLPGLPMFGHGQVEGLEEKYGMEYRRAYWDEAPDAGFIAYHQRQIFPLLRRRQLFAGVEHFNLYDFDTGGGIDENVYAFSNGPPGQRHLVIVNNAPHATSGRLRAAVDKAPSDKEGQAVPSPPLAEQLGIFADAAPFVRYRDLRDQREHLKSREELLDGLSLDLAGYAHHVLCQFTRIDDPEGHWADLHAELRGQPVASLNIALLRLRYQPLWEAFQELLAPARLNLLVGALTAPPLTAPAQVLVAELEEELETLADLVRDHAEASSPRSSETSEPTDDLTQLHAWLTSLKEAGTPGRLLHPLWAGARQTPSLALPVLAWWQLHRLRRKLGFADGATCWTVLTRFGLEHAWRETCASADDPMIYCLAGILARTDGQKPHPADSEQALAELVRAPDVRELLGIHEHAGTTWFNREGMTALCGALAVQASWPEPPEHPDAQRRRPLETFRKRVARAAAVGYRLDKFLHIE